MKFAKIAIAAIAALSLPAQAIAAEQKSCMAKEDVSALAVYLMPGLMQQALNKCQSFLPANASLLRNGPSAIDGYQKAAEGAKGRAAEAVVTIIGSDMNPALARGLGLPMMEALVLNGVAGGMDAESCTALNNIWAPLSSLPAQQIGELAVGILLAAESDDTTDEKAADGKTAPPASPDPLGNINICPFTATSAE